MILVVAVISVLIMSHDVIAAPPDHFPIIMRGQITIEDYESTGQVVTQPITMVWSDNDAGYPVKQGGIVGILDPDGSDLVWVPDDTYHWNVGNGLAGIAMNGPGFEIVVNDLDYGWTWHTGMQTYLVMYGFAAAMGLHLGMFGLAWFYKRMRGTAYATFE
ncbi:MAG: hypothetical protein IT446_08960 [Phycisphaerales bacterium]|nr:hypothetical protein [Phycisphaerales bacterium]